ncbi:protocadherin Fat 1-like isoform X2 [Mercenaria mercenaria]|uniref:protocadherin Fat 1-like isoform X2 n=1 Tax=Mercenaria mercenaria TaxID=6596 RepID=UPI00234ED4CA|nr:protocadherin Fat 1-like isoform X2 [Mercenaria mercenaria]
MKTVCIVGVLLFFFQHGDSEITDWTTPAISGAADGQGTLSIAEDQTISTEIVTFVAVTNASIVTYSLDTAVNPFAVAANGTLTITAALDFETTTSYVLHIKAVDNATVPGTGTATINVTVTDVNEADPVFSASYSPCITNGSSEDTHLTTVAATDADTANTISYSITAQTPASVFKINATSGLIQVDTGKILDKGTADNYTLVVEATDDGKPTRTGTTTVSVTVADSCQSGNGAVAVAASMVTLLVALFVNTF